MELFPFLKIHIYSFMNELNERSRDSWATLYYKKNCSRNRASYVDVFYLLSFQKSRQLIRGS